MSTDTQAIFFFIAFACFVVAAIIAIPPRTWWHLLVGVGLAAWVFVSFWSAVKA